MTSSTNRRGILGAVLAASATAALPSGAVGNAVALSAIDRRVLDLWRRRAKLRAICNRLSEQYQAADGKLPEWARSGPKYLRPDGSPSGLPTIGGWPMVADLGRSTPKDSSTRGPALTTFSPSSERPNVRGEEGADVEFNRSLAELAESRRHQKAEEERLGLDSLSDRREAAMNAFCDVEKKFEDYMEASVLGLAAVVIIAIKDGCEEIEGLNRATLAAIRPQLVGAIADAADRVLAGADEEEATPSDPSVRA